MVQERKKKTWECVCVCAERQSGAKGDGKRGKRRKGKRSIKSLVSYPVGALASCLHQEENRDKRVPVSTTGSGWSADELVPEYPSGQLY